MHRIKNEKKKSLDSHLQSLPSIIHKPVGFKGECNYLGFSEKPGLIKF